MVNDGTKSYDVAKDGHGQEAGACSLAIRRTEVATKAKLTYLRGQFFEVQIHHDKWDTWTHCFTIWNYTLPGQVYLGFTAHTGDVSDAHDVVSVSTSNIVYHGPQSHEGKRKPAGRRRSPGSGPRGFRFFAWLSWLLKWIAILTMVVLIFVVGRAYMSKQKRSSLKRF